MRAAVTPRQGYVLHRWSSSRVLRKTHASSWPAPTEGTLIAGNRLRSSTTCLSLQDSGSLPPRGQLRNAMPSFAIQLVRLALPARPSEIQACQHQSYVHQAKDARQDLKYMGSNLHRLSAEISPLAWRRELLAKISAAQLKARCIVMTVAAAPAFLKFSIGDQS